VTAASKLRREWLPRPGERFLPALSAVFLALSYPPLHPLVLPFVGLVPLVLWIHDLAPAPDGRRAAQRGGLVFGTLYFGSVFYWLLVALIWFTKLAILAYLAALALIVVITAIFMSLLHRAIKDLRAPLWVALPVVWTGLEWTRAHLPSTLAFPWLGLGTSLTGFPELVGIAELVGARGVTFWIALVNGLLASLVLSLRVRGPWKRYAVAAVTVLAVPMVWGVWRAGTLEMRPAGRVAVVQPNIAEHLKLDAKTGRDSTFAALDRLMPLIEPGSASLVVLPEMTLPVAPMAIAYGGDMYLLQRYSRETGAPLLFGAYGFVERPDGSALPYNSAFLMEPHGLSGFQYDKRYLVPIVERVPFLPMSLFRAFPFFGEYGVGEGWPLAQVDETAFGVLICYESVFPEASRAFRLEGADVLLNITNDAWYGREPLYARTTALWQHPAHMVMRAIENRMGVARSANTGISLFVDPVGRVHGATRLFVEGVAIEEVVTTDVITFYTRYGDLLGNAAAGATLLLLLWGVAVDRGRKVEPSLDPSPPLV
jgi:apolipoprotein N-acyltransferase